MMGICLCVAIALYSSPSKYLPLPRRASGLRFQLLMDPAPYIRIQDMRRGTPFTTEGLFRARRVDQEDRRSRRKSDANRSHRCRWHR